MVLTMGDEGRVRNDSAFFILISNSDGFVKSYGTPQCGAVTRNNLLRELVVF